MHMGTGLSNRHGGFFIVDRLMVGPDGICPTALKRIAWFEVGLEGQVSNEGGHVGVLLLEALPFALPDVSEPVPEGE